MNRTAETLVEQAGAYAHLFDRVSVGGRSDGASSATPIRLSTDPELVAEIESIAQLRRFVDAEELRLAGEVGRRSEVPDDFSLAKRMGTTGATDLFARLTGMPREQAGTILALAKAVRPREALDGASLPAKRQHVADAVGAGLLDLHVAAAIVRVLAKVAPGLMPAELERLEQQLVAKAQEGFTADELLQYLRKVPDYAWPDGAGSREDEQAVTAKVGKRKLDNGLTRWTLDLDSLTSGFFETALDAKTSMRRFTIELGDGPHLDEQDRRPLAQRRVDGVRLLAKQAVRIDDGQLAGTAVTLLVTMTEDALKTGVGSALLVGCQETISAATARMLAADAEIIPVVLRGKSQTLDLGTGVRFYSEAQRRAMALRDQGCAGPCCDAPLSWCDAAHINPAGYGSTSVRNGILLCWRCHLLLDKHGWQVERDEPEERWWWTPPPWIDPSGRRRPGGRIPPIDLSE